MISAFGLVHFPTALWAIPVALVGGFIFASLGLITTALVPSIDSMNFPIFLLIFPMFLFSGTFFPIDILPAWARAVAKVLPLTHIAILVRGIVPRLVPAGMDRKRGLSPAADVRDGGDRASS